MVIACLNGVVEEGEALATRRSPASAVSLWPVGLVAMAW